jgi:DNA-binding GntR family transcriptional regulator
VSEPSPRGTYLVVAEALRQVAGEVQSGEALPSEADLMAQYGVSRTTIRRALKVLADDGLIESTPGVGWRPTDAGREDRRSLAERMAELISAEGLTVGAPFPSEVALSHRFGVSRNTVRKALGELEGRGFLVAAHGKGRTVRALPNSESFT